MPTSSNKKSSSSSPSSTIPSKSTFQGRRYIAPAWFKELCAKEEHLWEESYEKDVANGPLTEPFPRRRPVQLVSTSSNKGSALGWNYNQVSIWLKENGLSRHIKTFRKHRISGPALLSLRPEHLETLELDLRDQCVFLRQINTLNKQVSSTKVSELRRRQNIQSVRRIQNRIQERDSGHGFVKTLHAKIRDVERDRRGIRWIKKESVQSKGSISSSKDGGKVHFKDDGSKITPRWNRKSENRLRGRRVEALDSSKLRRENDNLVSRMKHLFSNYRLRRCGERRKSSTSSDANNTTTKKRNPFFYLRHR